jgi:hypothetical protein
VRENERTNPFGWLIVKFVILKAILYIAIWWVSKKAREA